MIDNRPAGAIKSLIFVLKSSRCACPGRLLLENPRCDHVFSVHAYLLNIFCRISIHFDLIVLTIDTKRLIGDDSETIQYIILSFYQTIELCGTLGA